MDSLYAGSCLAPSLTSEEEDRLNTIDRELSLVVPIETLMRESLHQLRRLGKMIGCDAFGEGADELDACLDQELEIIRDKIKRQFE